MTDYNNGHRKRLRKKFAENRKCFLYDYEYLELLLTYSIPRKDVKPIAKRLISELGSLENVFDAAPERLAEIDGIGENTAVMITLIKEMSLRLSQQKAMKKRSIKSAEEAIEYFENLFYGAEIEKFYFVSLDNNGRVIAFRSFGEGEVNFIEINPRRIFKAAIQDNAAKIIIAHNHPKGNIKPSAADIDFTLKVRNTLNSLNMELVDHIIIGGDRSFSMRSSEQYSGYFHMFMEDSGEYV